MAGVVYSACLAGFNPTTPSPLRNYVLAYLGKETELETLSRCLEHGIRIVGFGSKIPSSMVKVSNGGGEFDFRGKVSDEELTRLYTNALFTALPVTDEPFGEVPLESMACGTPVLTYGRQGQLESIIDGRTGWLVANSDEFVSRATDLWERKSTGIASQACLTQAARFSSVKVGRELYRFALPA
jgi:glycosyltransferase involved in cell wall biosynthesis